MVDAGRIVPIPKGTYSASTQYEFLDFVYYPATSTTYIAKQSTTGHAPTDTTYWQIFAAGQTVDTELLDSATLSLFLDQIKSCAYMLHEIYYIDDRVTDSNWRCPESVCTLWKESLLPDTGRLIREIISWLEKFIAEHLDKAAAEAYCKIDGEIYRKEQAIQELERKKAALAAPKKK